MKRPASCEAHDSQMENDYGNTIRLRRRLSGQRDYFSNSPRSGRRTIAQRHDFRRQRATHQRDVAVFQRHVYGRNRDTRESETPE